MITQPSLIAIATACLSVSSPAMAGPGNDPIDISGLQSWALDGDPLNTTHSFQLADPGPIDGFGYIILGIYYDFTVQTIGNSWLSDLNIRFGNSTGTFHGSWPDTFRPGEGMDLPGTQRFTGYFDTDIHLNEDGLFQLELFESFDDQAGADAVLLEGSTMSFRVFIPAPSSAALLAIGALATGTRRRR